MYTLTGITRTLRQRARSHQRSFGAALGFAGAFLFYLWADHFQANNADNASMVLAGQAMLHANPLLHGWYLPADSFITTEIPLYALTVGLSPSLIWALKVVPALLYATTVLCATWLAGVTLGKSFCRLALASCLAVLAFPTGSLFSDVMQGPMHIATICLSLVSFLLYDRVIHQPSSHAALIACGLVTTWNIIGDPMAELLVPMPLLLVSGMVLWHTRGRDALAWKVGGIAIGSLATGILLRMLLIHLGTHIAIDAEGLTDLPGLWRHLQWLILGTVTFFQLAPNPQFPPVVQFFFWIIHLGFWLLLVVGLVRMASQKLFPLQLSGSMEAVLLWALIVVLTVFLVTTVPQDAISIRYLIPAVVITAILTFRAMAPLLKHQGMRIAVLTLFAINATTLALPLTRPAPSVSELPVIAFLQAHHLHSGLGSFWLSANMTVQSNGQIQMHQVRVIHGKITAYHWLAAQGWFAPSSLEDTNFLMYRQNDKPEEFYQAALRSFGQPTQVYTLQDIIILTWNHSISFA